MTAPPDNELAVAAGRGDDSAFAEIHDRYAPALQAYCARILGSREEAEDAVQQTFLKAHQAIRRPDDRGELAPWLYTIARNESITILRARSRRPIVGFDADPRPPALPAEEVAAIREELREALSDISELPQGQREALVMSGLGSAPGSEVAEAVGCEPNNVKTLVFRARARLSDRRAARQLDCREVREQMTGGGAGVLRRRLIREHLRGCERCADLAAAPRHRRKLALPIVLWPFVAHNPFSGLGGGVGTAAAASAAAGAASGGVAPGGVAAGVGAKALTATIAIAVSAGGLAANRDSAVPTPFPATAKFRSAEPRGGSAQTSGATSIAAPLLSLPAVPSATPGQGTDPNRRRSDRRSDRSSRKRTVDRRGAAASGKRRGSRRRGKGHRSQSSQGQARARGSAAAEPAGGSPAAASSGSAAPSARGGGPEAPAPQTSGRPTRSGTSQPSSAGRSGSSSKASGSQGRGATGPGTGKAEQSRDASPRGGSAKGESEPTGPPADHGPKTGKAAAGQVEVNSTDRN